MSPLRFCVATACVLQLAACAKQAAPTAPPPEPVAEAPEPEPEPEPDPGPKDTLEVATFNLQWAHDPDGEAPKAAKKARAVDDNAWKWKVEGVAKVLADRRADVVALQELGGEDELYDIVSAVKELKGPEYDYAFVKSDDPFTGHHVAILSTFPLVDARRLNIHLRRHLAVDIELPEEQVITVIAIHAPEGPRSEGARLKQLKALKREVDKIRKEHPAIVLGTLGSGVSPNADGYFRSSAGLLAGASTRNEDDDCADSVDVGVIVSTTREQRVADRIYACGLEMEEADTHEDGIVRGLADEGDQPWSANDPAKDPERDISDHLMVIARIKRPKPPPPEEPAEQEGEDGGEAIARLN